MRAFINNIKWDSISIKNRLLIVFSICIALSSLLNILINHSTNIPNEVYVIVIIVNLVTIYYATQNLITDIERLFYLSILISFLPIAWVYNGGLVGSIPLYFFVYLAVSILCLSNKYRNYFLIYILFIAGIITVIQIYFPKIITPYHSIEAQLFDLNYSFIMVNLIIITITFSYANISEQIQFKLLKSKIELNESYNQLAISKEIAENATRAKSNFITNISHEIRTPLNGIVGVTDLLQTSALNEEQKQLLNTLKISSYTLLELINDLLDLSKIEANKLTIQNEIFEIRTTIDNIKKLMSLQIINRDIILLTEIEKDTPEYIQLDRNKYKQILINLISNAIKFTKKGKIICSINYNYTKNSLITTVKDTGIGIDSKNIKKLFTPFTQLKQPSGIPNKGIGMGLTIAKKMIELMDGEISVDSTINEGSTFTFSIPTTYCPPKESKQNIKKNISAPPIKHFHILICEDNKINQLVLSKMLEVMDHTYELANNGQEAINICETKTFDIILMDIMMPIVDGIQASKIILENYKKHNLKEPKIIVCSANVHQIKNKEELTDIISDYLVKPIKFETLEDTLNKY